jgi:hypothetical protein
MTEEPKCRDCKWLTGKKNIRGIECMNPKNQEKWNKAKTLWMGELRKDSARYKQGSALACKKFEAKESEHMGRYIDADEQMTRIKQAYESMGVDTHGIWNKQLAEAFKGSDVETIRMCLHAILGAITQAPSIDIVRCQDCKHWVYNFNGCARNPCTEPWYATDFCNYGERRTDG